MNFFSNKSIFFEVFGYALSYLEFFAVVSGIAAIILSARANIWSWPIGLINVFLSAFFYYQIQLYPDMFLMAFFFATNILGWWRWANPNPAEEDRKKQLKVSFMPRKIFFFWLLIGGLGTFAVGKLAGQLHHWMPNIFNLPSAYPYVDSFILVMSVITTFLMVEKKIECWIIWLLIDLVATYLYFLKGAKFFGVEYALFSIIAGFALWNWIKEYRSYGQEK